MLFEDKSMNFNLGNKLYIFLLVNSVKNLFVISLADNFNSFKLNKHKLFSNNSNILSSVKLLKDKLIELI